MNRIKRSNTVPDFVSISNNHCNYPIIYPHTKKLENHTLPTGSQVWGVGNYDKDGELNYVIGFGSLTLKGKRITALSKTDGQVLFGLLAYLQLRNRKLKKDKVFIKNSIGNSSLKFKSMYHLLKFLKLPTNNTFYYERVKESLYKIYNTTLYFNDSYYNPKRKKKIEGIRSFRIFNSLDYMEDDNVAEDEYLIHIEFSKKWINMHESHFVINELELYKKLSEVELNLRNLLEPWRKEMFYKGKEVARDLETVCYRIGYSKSPLFSLRQKIKKALGVINAKCHYDYQLRFEKNNIIFYSEAGKTIKDF